MDDPNAKVLSFHDVVLRASDVRLLNGSNWLNDQVIAFYFEYLGRVKYQQLAGPSGPVLLVPGSIAYLLSNCGGPEVAASLLEPLQASKKSVIIFAVNDNPEVGTAEGGSHWSTLVYERHSGTFRHYDSSYGCSNRASASKLYKAIHAAVSPGQHSRLVQVDGMPQQRNSFDCGVYVMAVADAGCCWMAAATDQEHVDWQAREAELGTTITPEAVTQLRRCTLGIIQELQAQKRAAT
mmetsp:Transcript_8932/g.19063  ORF Transcript_8932/g.19063 Transcript_8932/m.19063 type:complete len:237 (+) Transcript_8932:90-800(+)|eukprot:CAMPEP_0202905322 /NCGR_PEP_ID=MMETSP1392-20130828/33680_1 /ASSEMBLY_ACC=CAM_ASM_000868 /TAXON_ID=225041 /ORGANISM="Chlamydomonas chlamydogama, Strain SAG 11-48b" /LENGTH=236 /DNA_ID=CAMNT_0049593363 /DNA_START=22 /DNA_END=732 /DNA_ORIENTATION=+